MHTARFTRSGLALGALALLASGVQGCEPSFSDRPSLVSGPKILAVRADPAEVAPGGLVTLSALVVDAQGTVAAPPSAWAFCRAPKLVAENGAVSRDCTGEGATAPIGTTLGPVMAPVPVDACSLFGPQVAADSNLRPRDPDPTGGFYTPVRLRTNDQMAFGLLRTTCDLANAPGDIVTAFTQTYKANRNPRIASIARVDPTKEAPFVSATHGESVTLRVRWADTDAEHYPYYDAASVSLVDRRESLRVSFFTTAGSFDLDRSGRDESDPATFTDNVWHVPNEPTHVTLWFVLRDSRGGVAFATATLDVN
jgi:hypothetical protein